MEIHHLNLRGAFSAPHHSSQQQMAETADPKSEKHCFTALGVTKQHANIERWTCHKHLRKPLNALWICGQIAAQNPFGSIRVDHQGLSKSIHSAEEKLNLTVFLQERVCVYVCMYIYIDFNFTTPAQPNQVPKILYTDVDYPKRSHYWYLPQKKVIIIYYKSKANQDWYYKNHGYSDKKCQVIIINHFNNHTHRIHGAGIYANIWGILMVKYGKC